MMGCDYGGFNSDSNPEAFGLPRKERPIIRPIFLPDTLRQLEILRERDALLLKVKLRIEYGA